MLADLRVGDRKRRSAEGNDVREEAPERFDVLRRRAFANADQDHELGNGEAESNAHRDLPREHVVPQQLPEAVEHFADGRDLVLGVPANADGVMVVTPDRNGRVRIARIDPPQGPPRRVREELSREDFRRIYAIELTTPLDDDGD